MDLRLRLLAYLSGFSLLLLLCASLVVIGNVRQDVAEEVRASARLAAIMLTIGEMRQQGTGPLKRLIEGGQLRHVSLTLESPMAGETKSAATEDILLKTFARWFLPDSMLMREQRIQVGDEVLVIRADPQSEIREILRDSARMLGLLLLFSLGSMLAAWYAVQRALAPVREFEDGLGRLADGETDAVLPKFELKEFRRIAEAIDRLAVSLAESQATERSLAQRLLTLQESERRELARELHDEFGQSLTAIGVAAAFIERHAGSADAEVLKACARDARTQAVKVSHHVAALLGQLRPYGLEEMGMKAALQELFDGWRKRIPGIILEISLPSTLPQVSMQAGLTLYRTSQEALTNVVRHSGAQRVRVVLDQTQDGLRLSICDDGCGKAHEVMRRRGGGLMGMMERARMVGGRMDFKDAPGGGLCLTLYLPLVHSLENDE